MGETIKMDTTSLIIEILAQKLTIERYRNAERLGVTFMTYSEIAEMFMEENPSVPTFRYSICA